MLGLSWTNPTVVLVISVFGDRIGDDRTVCVVLVGRIGVQPPAYIQVTTLHATCSRVVVAYHAPPTEKDLPPTLLIHRR